MSKPIELGGGNNPRIRPNVDKRAGPNVDIVADFEKPLPLPSDEYSYVFSMYAIEHISWRNVTQFIQELYRISATPGMVEIFTANLLEQCKVVAESKEWDMNFSTMLFGDQDYPDNTHRVGFSPDYITKLFLKAGFTKVEVIPLPTCKTDMIIRAYKDKENVRKLESFERTYFDGTGGGYQFEGYRDFVTHLKVVDDILARKPASVLDIAGARGYITKRLNDQGIRAICMDMSKHCFYTRVANNFVLQDARKIPWPFKDKEFDLAVSLSFFEHLDEYEVDQVLREVVRVSNRGLFSVTFEKTSIDRDITHKTFKPLEWWVEKFKAIDPKYVAEFLTETYSTVDIGKLAPSDGLVKLNLGSYVNMFYYGWENIDVLQLKEWADANGYKFLCHDLTKGVPKPDNSVDMIFSAHFLEHLSPAEGRTFLKDCLRALKTGGLIRLEVPSARILSKMYLEGQIRELSVINKEVEEADSDANAFYSILTSGHESGYDDGSLWTLLADVGFIEIEVVTPFMSREVKMRWETTPSQPEISCFIEATKGKGVQVFQVGLPTGPPVISESLESVSRSSPLGTKSDRLKIGLFSTRFFGVPPKGYSGLEMIVWDLACGLSELGHEVTLFAPEGSIAPPNGHLVETGPALHVLNVDWVDAERRAFSLIKDKVKGLDILHGHNWFGFEYLAKNSDPSVKVCHTHHGGLNMEYWGKSKPPFKLNLIAISKWMSSIYQTQGFTSKFVYNGIELEKYPFKAEKTDKLLFVGRFDKFKQPHLAIDVARKLDVELDLVGGTFVQDPAYVEELKRQSLGKIHFHPDVSHEVKVGFMQNAKCLLFPSAMGEPFGLVAAEAMSTGTPVVALNDGAIEEVVQEGGIVCDVFNKEMTPQGLRYSIKRDPADAMLEALSKIGSVKPEYARKNAERFSRKNMALAYETLYKEILSGNEW